MSVASRLSETTATLEVARARSPRAAASFEIVAVSKRHPAAAIAEAYAAGARSFGENYAQEMATKAAELSSAPDLVWHFIGQLQRNKVSLVVGTARLIHAVDSERLLREIDRRAGLTGVCQELLIAASLAGEAQKSGASRAEVGALVSAAATLPNVRCVGLMTMPPLSDDAEKSRPYFAELRELRDALTTAEQPLVHLSMGTSGDCGVAIEEGATLVRIGTSIFGERPSG